MRKFSVLVACVALALAGCTPWHWPWATLPPAATSVASAPESADKSAMAAATAVPAAQVVVVVGCCATPTPCIPTPTVAASKPAAPAPVVDCGPWSQENGVLVWKGNTSQDVCQLSANLATVRSGVISRFTRTSSFTLAICAADITNDQGGHWVTTDCDQSAGITFPAGTYTVTQPAGYSNGGYRATNK